MKKIDLIIPTRNRWDKLQHCLKSIPKQIPGLILNVIVVCDGDKETAYKLLTSNDGLVDRIIFVRDHSGSVYCRNLVTQTVEDALLYAVDDIDFLPDSISIAAEKMQKIFPDEDGVVGFKIINSHSQSKTGVALIGQKFLCRYPQKKLFYPGYFHFSCQEIERLAVKLGKLHFETKAGINHYHPGFYKSESDNTHAEARIFRRKDQKMSLGRKAKGLIWGDNE